MYVLGRVCGLILTAWATAGIVILNPTMCRAEHLKPDLAIYCEPSGLGCFGLLEDLKVSVVLEPEVRYHNSELCDHDRSSVMIIVLLAR